jgi:hypothetical protein
MKLNGIGLPQRPFKWDAPLLKLPPLYTRFISPPPLVAACGARIYYVFGKDFMTHACIHLGVHEHPMKDGEYQDFKERNRTFIGEQVKKTSLVKNFAIVMEAIKELIEKLLLGPAGGPQKTFILKELVPVLDTCKYMSLSSIKNDMTTFKYLRRFGVMDGITMFKDCSYWAYV